MMEDRIKVMKYLLGAVVLTSIIPYDKVPWASYAVVSVYAMFVASTVFCLLTWLVARIVKADKICVSIGVVPSLCLYKFKTVDIMCGPFPFPDTAMPASVVEKTNKCWAISTIPSILTILIGCAFVYYRNYLFATSPDAVAAMVECHTYSIAALFSLSCILISVVGETLYLEKYKGIYPECAFIFTFVEYALIFTGIIGVSKYGTKILEFIGI